MNTQATSTGAATESSSRIATAAAAIVFALALLLLWLELSYLASARVVRAPAAPPTGRLLGSFPMVLAATALLGAPILTRLRRRSREIRLGGMLALVLLLWGGPDAALPGVAAFAAATLALRWDLLGQMRRAFTPRVGLARALVAAVAVLVFVEGALQGIALVVQDRARLHLAHDPAADLTLLCLGDSFTYGLGASDPAHAWPGQLQAMLNRALPGRRISVLNAGQPGRNSSALAAWLARELPRLEPDVVMVACGQNNQWDVRDVDPAALGGLSRAELWKLGLHKAALQVRLYRLLALRNVRFAPPDEKQLPFGLRVEYLDPETERARVAALQEQLSRDAGNTAARKELAIRLCRLGRNPEALEQVEIALRQAPADPDLWNLKGWILSFLRRRDPAVEAFDRAVTLGQPTDDYYLCISFANLFNEEAALAHVRRLEAASPELYARLPKLDEDFFRRRRYLRILDRDLEAMRRTCDRAGALLLVHDYPYAGPVSSCLEDFGRAHDCFLVSHSQVFEKRRSEGTADSLFAYDGHCSDEGYAMMAGQIVPPLLSALQAHGLIAPASP